MDDIAEFTERMRKLIEEMEEIRQNPEPMGTINGLAHHVQECIDNALYDCGFSDGISAGWMEGED